MLAPIYAFRTVLGTSHGVRMLVTNILIAFGLVSTAIQFIGQLFPTAFGAPVVIALFSLGICLLWGIARAYPRSHIRHCFDHPETQVTVLVGDLFEQDAHLVVGFTDTFDTASDGDRIISTASVQGQLAERVYNGDHDKLDRELQAALDGTDHFLTETRDTKRLGKLLRYPVGTVAVLGEPKQRIFALAYSRMSNDLVAQSSVSDWWTSLSSLWDAVYRCGQNGRVAMPLVGSGLARMSFLDRQRLLKMILLSFIARSRESPVCRELRIVIHPADLSGIDMLDAATFLRSL